MLKKVLDWHAWAGRSFLTTQEVATELGVTRRRVTALIHAGRLKAKRIGRAWAIESRDVDAVRVRVPGRPRHTR